MGTQPAAAQNRRQRGEVPPALGNNSGAAKGRVRVLPVSLAHTPRGNARGFLFKQPALYMLSLANSFRETAIALITLQILLIIFVATLIRSAFGFGEALVAVPLLAFFIPLNVAAPLAVLVSITIAAIVVVQDWRHIHLFSTGWLVLPTLFGIPLGVLLLTSSQ